MTTRKQILTKSFKIIIIWNINRLPYLDILYLCQTLNTTNAEELRMFLSGEVASVILFRDTSPCDCLC